jgi:hypothetical protein
MDGYGLSVAGPGTLTEKRPAIAPVAGRTAVGAVVCVGTGVSAYDQHHEPGDVSLLVQEGERWNMKILGEKCDKPKGTPPPKMISCGGG